jgi:hypothetical protein
LREETKAAQHTLPIWEISPCGAGRPARAQGAPCPAGAPWAPSSSDGADTSGAAGPDARARDQRRRPVGRTACPAARSNATAAGGALRIGAQAYLERFYASLGFVRAGDDIGLEVDRATYAEILTEDPPGAGGPLGTDVLGNCSGRCPDTGHKE